MPPRTLYAGLLVLALLTVLTASPAKATDPVAGPELQAIRSQMQYDLQNRLRMIFSEAEGYTVSGPLYPDFEGYVEIEPAYHTVRVMCANWSAFESALSKLDSSSGITVVSRNRWMRKARQKRFAGYRGIMCRIKIDNQIHTIQFLTTQQFRWILWAERYLSPNGVRLNSKALRPYALAISDYLHAIDTGNLSVSPPVATSYSLTASIDLYEVLPEFIIDGYDNFMGFMHRYREINADFADGVLAFVAGDSLIEWFKANAPDEAFPNKGRVMLQHEYREFFNLKGSVREVNGLTTSGFDTLSTGSYIFSVGIDGSVRIAKDLSVSAMKTIENEIDQKLPRVNHAFLFPVEPILCAGTFTVETDSVPRIVKINAESGHYYYCNLTPTIREDISIKSDHYILTLGHFFKALDEMGIFYKGALISKF